MYEYQYLIGGALSIIVSLYILFNRPKTLPLSFLFLFGVAMSSWEISSFMYRTAPSVAECARFFRIMIISSHLGFPLYLLTILSIKYKWSTKKLFLVLLPLIIQILIMFQNDYIENYYFFLTKSGWGYRVVNFSPLFILSSVIFVGYLFAIIISLFNLIRKADLPLLKKKYIVLLLGFLFFQVIGTTMTNALIALKILDPIFQMGGIFQFFTFLSILYALTLKEKNDQLLVKNIHDFSELYLSFLKVFYNFSVRNDLGETLLTFKKFVRDSGIEDYSLIYKDEIKILNRKKVDLLNIVDRNLKFFAEEKIDRKVTDNYLRVLKAVENVDGFESIVEKNEEFLKSSDLLYGLSGYKLLEKIKEDTSLKRLDEISSCLQIYKRILLSLVSEIPKKEDKVKKIISRYGLDDVVEITKYGEISIGNFKSILKKLPKDKWISEVIYILNNVISDVFEELIIKSNYDIDKALKKLKHVLRLNREVAEKLGIYPKLLGTLATKVPKTEVHKLYSDYLEELVKERTRALKEAQDNLLKAQRLAAIGEAASMIGHDLRNPLQAIMYSLFLAKKELESSPNANLMEIVKIIEEQVEYMNKIVSDLQDYARPIKPNFVETNFEKIVREVLSTVRIPANIKVDIDIDEAFTAFPTDPLLMKRVLTNLITNAIQAMENGGLLRISAYKKGNDAFISIQDTGVGIPEENLSKIFQPFFTTKAKGQGLGLAVCKRIIESLQGSITLDSKVGKGTTVTIKLPFKNINPLQKLQLSL